MSSAYELLIQEVREIGLLESVSSVLGWDERVQLPARGAELRADQLSLLATTCHARLISHKTADLLARASDTRPAPGSDADVNLREIRRSFDRARKLPTKLVQELTRTSVLAQQAWVDARAKSDFQLFRPWLEKIVSQKKQEADCIGYRDHPYDALLDEYEPDETAANLRRVFGELKQPLVELTGRIVQSGRPAPAELLQRSFPVAVQHQLAREVSAAIGFDFEGGRLDESVHPFCSGIGPGDTRLTTRYDEHDFQNAFFGTLHESGHGLYHQGLPAADFGTPCGEDISLGIHESQSRMWENQVGRSRAFWRFFLPRVRTLFPGALAGVSDDDWHRAINDVRPSLIRTESDETTYNLHVLLRFELELAMISGDLAVADLPAAWNERMRTYLGITPPNDAVGVLQDIHWSGGAIGYFPTYTLGNLYAAQFFEQAKSDLGNLDASLAAGEFRPLLQWLRVNIHSRGKRLGARELVQQVTGKPLSAEPLLTHLRRTAAEVYGV